jgi:hypothetical protein
MTPLHLEILMWYYTRGAEYPYEGNETRIGYAAELQRDGLLCSIAGDKLGRSYAPTDKGKFWIEQVLALPLPIQRWVMPTSKEIA